MFVFALSRTMFLSDASSLDMTRPTMDTEAIRSLMQQLQNTDIDADEEFSKLMRLAAHLVETMTTGRCSNIACMAGARPCLQVFMSDGWCTDLRTWFGSSRDGVSVQRSADCERRLCCRGHL